MKRARKSNRVSWALGSNLCQVKLFSVRDCPSKVGQKSQGHHQVKTFSMVPSTLDEDDDVPPGFEGNHFQNQSKVRVSHISQIKWECPPSFSCSYGWRVAAGEESREKDVQKLREMRVLESVYPRLSAIPASPFVSHEVEKECYDDGLTPLVPIIPIEEEQLAMDIEPYVAVRKHKNTPTKLQSQNLKQYMPRLAYPNNSQCNTSVIAPSTCGKTTPETCLGADLVAAVVASIMESNEQGSLVDMGLLKILDDPEMIGKLIKEHSTAAATVCASSSTASLHVNSSPLLKPVPEAVASGATFTTSAGLLPTSGLREATPHVSLLTTTPEKPALPSVSLPTSTLDKPATATATATPTPASTPSVPLSRAFSCQSAETHSVTMPPPPLIHTNLAHRPVNKNIPHLSNGVHPFLTSQSTQDAVISLDAASSSELSTVASPSSSANMHAVAKEVGSTAGTVPYQPSADLAFAVKDVNYYKNLIRQHGVDKQDGKDSNVDIRHNNFQDLKPVRNNNIKPGEGVFKIQKPCIYFKSSRGCRNGSNCAYKHDTSSQWKIGKVLVAQNAKRLKVGHENGRI